ncbi:MAG: hypothetical protein WBX27_20810 [Specibacter sp.]
MSGNTNYQRRPWGRSATKGAPLACVFLLIAVYATLGVLSLGWAGPATSIMIVGVTTVSLAVDRRLPRWQERLELTQWRLRPGTGTLFENLATAAMLGLAVFCIVAMITGTPAPWLVLSAIWAAAAVFGGVAIRRNPGLR